MRCRFLIFIWSILEFWIEKCKAKREQKKGQKFHQIDQVLFKNTITSFIILLPENLNKIKFVFIFLLGFKKSIKNMVYYTMLYHSNKNKISRILKTRIKFWISLLLLFYFTFFFQLYFSQTKLISSTVSTHGFNKIIPLISSQSSFLHFNFFYHISHDFKEIWDWKRIFSL